MATGFAVFGEYAKEASVMANLLLELGTKSLDYQKAIVANPQKYKFKKNDGSPVTTFDCVNGYHIVAALNAAFPDDPIVSEESADHDVSDVKNFLASIGEMIPLSAWKLQEPDVAKLKKCRRWWTIDPIDGTSSFLRADGQFAVASALIVDDQVVFSATAWPGATRAFSGLPDGPVVFLAAKGQGAWTFQGEGSLARVTANSKRSPAAIVSPSFPVPVLSSILQKVGVTGVEKMGSMTKAFAAVCSTAGPTFYLREPYRGEDCSWDIAPFALFVTEAGGISTTARGAPFSYDRNGTVPGSKQTGFVFSTNGPEFHAKLVAAMQEFVLPK
jgi:3'(2'), 5'-bisphosphate nucleotidase